MEQLYKKLLDYGKSDDYPFHMPGHKRQLQDSKMKLLYQMDITEIHGFDNLHEANGIILEAEKRAARLYGSKYSFFLINGSTCGILTAIHVALPKGGKILMARNCHKSAYHGAFLRELEIVYLYPKWDEQYDIICGILPEDVEIALQEHKDIKAVFITSPTFDGMISDIKKIAEITHKYGAILIVDEAHGAHFGLYKNNAEEDELQQEYNISENAIRLGADMVIHSLHKTLPSLTQTALLHINGNEVDIEQVKKYLSIFETSSPSYILMASMDKCMDIIEKKGNELFTSYIKRMKIFYTKLEKMKRLQVVSKKQLKNISKSGIKDWDIGKIIISVKKTTLSGQQLYDILREKHHLQMEMAQATYILAIATIMDSDIGLNRLAEALLAIDQQLLLQEGCNNFHCNGSNMNLDENDADGTHQVTIGHNKTIFTIAEAEKKSKHGVPWKEAVGKVSGEWVSIYPPGIPFLVPGEQITKEIVQDIEKAIKLGLPLQGLLHKDTGEILIISPK